MPIYEFRCKSCGAKVSLFFRSIPEQATGVCDRCGSADLMEALGVQVILSPDQIGRCIREVGIGFLFAPAIHKATKHAHPARLELKTRTVFNLLGPLTNPAMATHQLLGLYGAELVGTIACVLKNLGSVRAMVVHGMEGLDEISLCGPTKIAELRDRDVTEYLIEPETLGLKRCRLEELRGGSAEESAKIVRAVLARKQGAARDVVLLNSGAALYVSGKAPSISEGVRIAAESIDSGKAQHKLEQLAQMTNSA